MMIGPRNTNMWIGLAGLLVFAGTLNWDANAAESDSDLAQGLPSVAQQSATLVDDLNVLVSNSLHDDATVREPAIRELRQRGPNAVKALMGHLELRKSPRWAAVLDEVAQQKDAEYSGLYWYTDLNQAIAAAKQEKKPILSLRLLGKLTDELSCANSRFFRTTLYPNPAVRDLMANQFILHWQTVRAVPIVTIDFGNGRKIERTITGNSLHMVMDENGRPLDVLPGLYSAGAFCRQLEASNPIARRLASLNDDDFAQRRTEFHSQRLSILQQSWNDVCQNAGVPVGLPLGLDHPSDAWTKIAITAAGTDIVLGDEARRAVIERASPAEVAGRLALTKSISETPTMRLVRNVSQIINEDSVRNEYYLHAQIHSWFGNEISPAIQGSTEPLINRVYAELFQSPLNDPWYGLSKPDVYSALKNDGRIHAVTQNTGR